MVASTWPLVTRSPACTASTTAPADGAYKVGLTAATTLPSAATSRTKAPRSTVAMLRREAPTAALAENSDCAKGQASAASARQAAAAPMMTMRRRAGWWASGRSWAEVSRSWAG